MRALRRNWVLGGGIASGKSLVRRHLEIMSVPVIDADAIGHLVLEPEGPAFGAVADRWPEVIVNGLVDRARLGEIVFGNSEELAVLESITHPHIFDTIRSRVEEIGPGVIVEMPLLDRRPGPEWLLVAVDSREEVRLAASCHRPRDVRDRCQGENRGTAPA